MDKGGRLMTDHLILVIFVFLCVAFAAVRSFLKAGQPEPLQSCLSSVSNLLKCHQSLFRNLFRLLTNQQTVMMKVAL